MAGSRIKLKGAIIWSAIGILLLLFLVAMPVLAENAAITGTFTVKLVTLNVSASSLGVSSASISWDTNGNATSQVFYDTDYHDKIDDYAFHSAMDAALVRSHTVYLTGLSPSITYHYRVKSVAAVSGNLFAAVSDDYIFQTGAPSGSGYGYYGEDTTTVSLNGISGSNTLRLNTAGIVQSGILLTTPDESTGLDIPAGTRIINAQGQLPKSLSASIPISVPPISADVIVLMYTFTPEGVTFTPPIKLTMKYDGIKLPTGVLENTLYLAYWDGSLWQALPSTVDASNDTVSAFLSQFSFWALFGKMPVPVPAPIPVPTPIPTTITPPISTTTPTTTPIATPTPTPTITPTSVPAPSTTVLPASPTPAETPAVELGQATTTFWWILGGSLAAAVLIATGGLVAARRRRK